MRDLTTGSIPRHLVRMAVPMALGMLFQTLYYLIDLWFVARLGDAAVAGVTSAGTIQFIIMSLTQVLGVGTMVLISHAAGRKDRDDATLVFNQSLGLSALAFVVVLVAGYGLMGVYVRTIGADAATAESGATYLRWFLPALAMQFALISMGSAMRGSGIARPAMVVQMCTVILNAILAPVLIGGWGTGRPLGVAGAGLASTLAVAVGVGVTLYYFHRLQTFVKFDASQVAPRREVWMRMLRLGVPAGAEFALLFVNTAVVYWIIRGFGPAAQAGYGIGSRVMQAFFLPAMAVAFAASPVAGQNIGAGRRDRAREAFRAAMLMGPGVMLALGALCQWHPELLLRAFTQEAAVIETGVGFLKVASWSFIAQGVIFTCSGMFQALGNTVPSLVVSVTRVVLFAMPGVWLSVQPGFTLHRLWLWSAAVIFVAAALALAMLHRALGGFGREAGPVPAVVAE